MVVVGVGVGVEEAEVEPPLLVESNKLDYTVGSMIPGKEQDMLAAVEREEVQG